MSIDFGRSNSFIFKIKTENFGGDVEISTEDALVLQCSHCYWLHLMRILLICSLRSLSSSGKSRSQIRLIIND